MLISMTCYQFSEKAHSSSNKGLFGLAYFRAYIKQLMQINKFLCTIYKFLR